MSTPRLSLSIAAVLLGSTAVTSADVPTVAADITPVHSLVARVMDGLGEPQLVIPSGASPHEYNLRPSEASALQDADLVFWMGEDLTPWLNHALETLAGDAQITALLELDGTTRLATRESALFEAHSHGDEHEHEHDDHAQDDHDHDHAHNDDHDHDSHDEHAHDDHQHDDHDHDDHGHGEHDPHAWLSPNNAATWLNVIAAQLSSADPDNAGTYFANASAAIEELEALKADVNAILEPVRGGSYIVFHDAYQYFEVAFDLPASGAISLSDATDPSPARITEIQDRIREEGIDCVLSEPQFNAGLVATVLDGTDASTAVIDPLGSTFEPGPDLYPQVIREAATSLSECLQDG
jgi:zinc transport system substrate-binding protein